MSAKGKDKNAGKGGKGKDKKDPNKMTNVDKQFCELTIADLNQKLARLRTHLASLDDNNVTLVEKLRELEFDRTDVAAHLDRQLKEKEDTEVELIERLTEITKVRKSENEQSQQRIFDLESKYKVMYDQLTSEIKLLSGKLSSLDEFRAQRDVLLSRLYDQDQQLKEKDREHKMAILDIEQKDLVDKDALKKEVDQRLLEVADDFMKAYEQRSSAYMNRLIRENFALRKELDTVIDTHIKMNKEYDDQKFKKKEMELTVTNLKEINVNLIKRVTSDASTINKMNKQIEILRDVIQDGIKYRQEYRRLTKDDTTERFTYENAIQKLLKLGKRVEKLTLEKHDLLALHEAQESEIVYLRGILRKVRRAVETILMPGKQQDDDSVSSGEERTEKQARKDLMNELMNIMVSDRLDPEIKTASATDVQTTSYHPGVLGFLPTEPKASLLQLFYQKPDRDTPQLSAAAAAAVSKGPMTPLGSYLPTCTGGNDIFDVEMGSAYFVSSSVQEEVMEEQAHESVDEEGDDSSAGDKEDISCGKEDKAVEKKTSATAVPTEPSTAPSIPSGVEEEQEAGEGQPIGGDNSSINADQLSGFSRFDEDIAEFFFY